MQLLALEEEHLEIIELEVAAARRPPASASEMWRCPSGALIISILRDGAGFVPKADTVIEAGDQVLLILDPGLESADRACSSPPAEPGRRLSPVAGASASR